MHRRENDIVIVVIGLTGVRKSTFVSQLISDSEVPTIGHTLHSGTSPHTSRRCRR